MNNSPRTITVEVWFLDGARNLPPYGTVYRPHFVIDGTDDYMSGIQFENLPNRPFGTHIKCRAQLIYESLSVDYSRFSLGTKFDIREGSHTVGKGIVVND